MTLLPPQTGILAEPLDEGGLGLPTKPTVANAPLDSGPPTAFYRNTGVRLYHGDVVETLQSLPEGSVDLIFADPPYNLSNDGFTCYAGKRASVNKGGWDRSRGVDADFDFHYKWLAACRRVLKDNGALWVSGTYHSIHMCGYALQKQGWHLLNEICWYKPNAAPHLACRMFAASHETLLWARKTKNAKHKFHYDLMKASEWPGDFMKKPDKQMRSVWAIGTSKASEKKHGKHPTQKPESLLERIVLACSDKGDVVLDPFCGSATTGVAALRHNRNFAGVDSEKSYLVDLAVKRLEDAMRESDFFGGSSSVGEEYLDAYEPFGEGS